MNPYEAPRSKPASSPQPGTKSGTAPYREGQPCPECGGSKLGADVLARTRPGLFHFMVFGLFAMAFSKRSVRCEDCGTVSRYKSVSSKLAMALLIVMPVLYWFIRPR
jgi:hypothetical protein